MFIEGKQYRVRLGDEIYHCALGVTMGYIGGKWKSVVLWYLKEGPCRFSELRRLIPDVTEKMLSLQLKNLEKEGLVSRQVFAQVPVRVEYELTEEGKSLVPALDALAEWGREMGNRHGQLEEVPIPPGKQKTNV